MKWYAMILITMIAVASIAFMYKVGNHLTDYRAVVRVRHHVKLECCTNAIPVRIASESEGAYKQAEATLREQMDSWLAFLGIFGILFGLVTPLASYMLQQRSIEEEHSRMSTEVEKVKQECRDRCQLIEGAAKESVDSVITTVKELIDSHEKENAARLDELKAKVDSASGEVMQAKEKVEVLAGSISAADEGYLEFKKVLALAENGDAKAQFNVGYKLASGKGVEKDEKKAVEWYRKAANQGHAGAQCNLGYMYDSGLGVSADKRMAFDWYLRAANNGTGDRVAQNNLGIYYEYGTIGKQDYAEAFKWYERSARQGYAVAQCNLGLMYEFARGVEKCIPEALKWYEAAAKQNYSRAQFRLGYLYATGKEVEKDERKAVGFYRLSAKQNYDWAQNNLGVMYEYGSGVERDVAAAAEWYRKASDSGNITAACNLALLYEDGRGVGKCLETAAELYQKAAEGGSVRAMYRLAIMYEQGKGVAQDVEIARDWYQKVVAADNKEYGKLAVQALAKLFGEKDGSPAV